MKKIFNFLITLLLSFSFLNQVNAWSFSDLLTNGSELPYCQNDECGIDNGLNTSDAIDGLVTDQSASEYFQNVVVYILGFLYLVGVIMIIYAGFNLLTGAGDEEKAKNSKTMIIYVIIGILIIFLAGPIVNFILNIFNNSTTT